MSLEILEHVFSANGVSLNYAELPAPLAPLVLLHGGSARWQSFESLLPALAEHWHVYAPDFRGHGKSAWTPGNYRLQNYANDVITFLQEVVREPAFLFGHSLGGIVGVLVAAQLPQSVRGLVVGDAPLSQETWYAAIAPSFDRVAAWRELSGGQKPLDELVEMLKDAPIEAPDGKSSVPMRTVFGENSGFFPWMALNLYQNDPDMLTALLERFKDTAAGYDINRTLPALQCPVLWLQADPEAGGLMTDAEVEQARSLLSNSSHVRLQGIDHSLHHGGPERAQEIVRVLESYLTPLEANSLSE